MTAKEFYDYITKYITSEEALLKLLEGQVLEYEHLKFSSDENAIHPLLLIAMAAMDMGWVIAVPNAENNLDADIEGLIVGTEEYVNKVLDIKKEMTSNNINELKLIELDGQLRINFEE